MGIKLALFFLGSAVGSFINVLGMRYRADRPIFSKISTGGRSKCPNCGRELAWYELIPFVSFLVQLGRCRSCRNRISWQYPLIEALTGLVFMFLPGAIFRAYGLPMLIELRGGVPVWAYFVFAVFFLAVLTLIVLALIDYRLSIIPDQCNLLIALLGIFLAFTLGRAGIFTGADTSFVGHYALVFGLREGVWLNRFVAAVAGLAFFGAIVLLSRGRGMGLGDVKLAGALGLLLGYPDALLGLLFSFIIGGIWSIMLMLIGRKGFRSHIPFGPFMVAGAFLIIFLGKELLDWYFWLFP